MVELPALAGVGLIAYWLAKGRWRWPTAMLILFVVWTIILAGIWLQIDQRQASPLEYYQYDRWCRAVGRDPGGGRCLENDSASAGIRCQRHRGVQ